MSTYSEEENRMAKMSELSRRFPDDQESRQKVTTVVEHAAEGAATEEVRRELQEALEEAGTRG